MIILMLGALSLISPFSVDMYLPAFAQIANHLGTTTAAVSLSLSSYFIGFAMGQVMYGPLLDRFGRKKPLYAGLCLYLAASALCIHPVNLRMLIALRFLQAIGGCVAQVASVAMVRDFFPADQSARIFSLLFLIIGVSPLLAPSFGSLVLLWLGWQWIFVMLSVFAFAILLMIRFLLPEAHRADPRIDLRPGPLLANFGHIFAVPQFSVYAMAGAFSFAGLFTYVAGSPLIFMDGFHVSEKTFGLIFAVLTGGFIAGSQVNLVLLRTLSSNRIFTIALSLQVVFGLIFIAGSWLNWYGMTATLVLFFLFLSCIGLTYPNAAAIALRPFSRNVGSASALLGFIQMGVGALISTGIGFFGTKAVIGLLSGTSLLGAAIFLAGRRWVGEPAAAAEETVTTFVH